MNAQPTLVEEDAVLEIGATTWTIPEGHIPSRSNGPEPLPRDTDHASVIVSDVPEVVQHTRLDSRQAELALLSTIAHPA